MLLAALIRRKLADSLASFTCRPSPGLAFQPAAARRSAASQLSRALSSHRERQMAEPRKVPFVTISSFSTSAPTPESSKKRRREDEAVDITFGKDGGGSAVALGSGGGGGPFGNRKGGDTEVEEAKPTVRLNLTLTEPNERASAEFNYGELVNSTLTQVSKVWLRTVCTVVCIQDGPNLASLER